MKTDKVWTYPPREFYKLTGFKVAGGYNFGSIDPGNFGPQWREWVEQPEIMSMTWRYLVNLNPQLAAVNMVVWSHPHYGENGGMADWLMGVLSDINVDDIRWFTRPYRDMSIDGHANVILQKFTNVYPHWVVSPQTVWQIMGDGYYNRQ